MTNIARSICYITLQHWFHLLQLLHRIACNDSKTSRVQYKEQGLLCCTCRKKQSLLDMQPHFMNSLQALCFRDCNPYRVPRIILLHPSTVFQCRNILDSILTDQPNSTLKDSSLCMLEQSILCGILNRKLDHMRAAG